MGFVLIILIIIVIISTIIMFFLQKEERIRKKQLHFIKKYKFNDSIKNRVFNKYPHLDEEQINLVFEGLRTYFYICNMGGKKMVAMPSQVVDIAWHEFIIFTKLYDDFCKKGIGQFLHHTPTEVMHSRKEAQRSIKRVWHLSCAKEKINFSQPKELPLLFAIDALLEIKDGFHYSLNCRQSGNDYCACDISCTSSFSGGSDSDSDNNGSDGSGSSCSGGD